MPVRQVLSSLTRFSNQSQYALMPLQNQELFEPGYSQKSDKNYMKLPVYWFKQLMF